MLVRTPDPNPSRCGADPSLWCRSNGVFTSWWIIDPGPTETDQLNGLSTVNLNGQVLLSLDFAGAPQPAGARDMRNRPAVVTAAFNSTHAELLADVCAAGLAGPVQKPGQFFSIGSRRNEPQRHFKGLVSEVLVFNRSLSAEETSSLQAHLAAKWRLNSPNSSIDCNAHAPFPCSEMQAGALPDLQNATEFLELLRAHDLQSTVVAEALQLAVGYIDAFGQRCAELNSGRLAWTRGRGPAKASLESLLKAAAGIRDGAKRQLRRCKSDPSWSGDAVGRSVCALCAANAWCAG